MRELKRYKTARNILIFWCFFIGMTAIAGVVAVLVHTDNLTFQMQEILKYFQILPFSQVLFQNSAISIILLLFINGIPNIVTASFLFANNKKAIICGEIMGIVLMLCTCLQLVIVPFDEISVVYFILGLIQSLTGYVTWRYYKRIIPES